MKSLSFTCSEGHRTDALYESGGTFDKLLKASMLECTQCGRPGVQQALSMPNVNSGVSREKGAGRQEAPVKFREVGEDFYETAIRMVAGEETAEPISGFASQPEAQHLRDIGLDLRAIGPAQPPNGKGLN